MLNSVLSSILLHPSRETLSCRLLCCIAQALADVDVAERLDPRGDVAYVVCQYLPGPQALVLLEKFMDQYEAGEFSADFLATVDTHNQEFNPSQLCSTKRIRDERADDNSELGALRLDDNSAELKSIVDRATTVCKTSTCSLMLVAAGDKKDSVELWISGAGELLGGVPIFSFGAGKLETGSEAEAAMTPDASWLPFALAPESLVMIDAKSLPPEASSLSSSATPQKAG